MAVALAVSSASLRNGFALDDVPMVLENARITTLQSPWTYFNLPYWPGGGLYRPVTVTLFALLWKVGGGSPLPFHLANVVLNAVAAVMTFGVARRLLPPAAAALCGLLFAVHPVHVEAVASVVGLSELLCAVFVLGALLLALRGATGEMTLPLRLGIIGLGALAALSKEQGFVTPVLVVAAALAVAGRAGIRRVAAAVVGLSLVLVALLAVRTGVLGDLAGDQAAAPLRGLSAAARVPIFLGTIPSWTRLLLWPAALHFDYSPPGYPLQNAWSGSQLLGVCIVAAAAWLAWRCRHQCPAVTLGIAWAAVAILPVSNLLLPTGILLAERTLYLASAGVAIAVGGLVALAWPMLHGAQHQVAAALAGAVLVAGAWRSGSRMLVWRNNDALFAQVDIEAADNYRAHRSRALDLDRRGYVAEAEREYRRSIELWPRDPKVHEDLAILLHRQQRDDDAIAVLEAGLQVDPAMPAMRSKLYFIEAGRGRWTDARATAEAGAAAGDTMFTALVRRADSALATTTSSPSPVP